MSTNSTVEYDKNADTVYTVSEHHSDHYTDNKVLSFKHCHGTVTYSPASKSYYVNIDGYAIDSATAAPKQEFYLPDVELNLVLTSNNWEITGKETVAGRECAVVHVFSAYRDIDMWIDSKTGLCLKYEFKKNSECISFVVTSILYDEETANAPAGFTTAEQFRDMLKNCPDNGMNTSFLDGVAPTAQSAEIKGSNPYDYPVNEYGLTYGSDDPSRDIIRPEDEPNLQSVVGDHGVKGYCYKSELHGAAVNWPEDALRKQEIMSAAGNPPRVLNVYESDGETIIDTFTIGEKSRTPETVSETTTETTAETTTTETTAAAETTVTTPENTKSAATTAETTTEQATSKAQETTAGNGKPTAITSTNLFEALDALPYHAISCDGVPTHTLKGPDGTIYHLNLDNTSSYHYVWRRPSLVDDPDNEAPLTDEIVDYILSHMDELPIVPFSWI